MPPRPLGWRVAQPDDPGIAERRVRQRGPFAPERSGGMLMFAVLLSCLAWVAIVCIFARVL